MGRLSLMVLSLTVLLLAANSLPPVDEDQLQEIVLQILNRYRPTYQVDDQRKTPMFSLAVSIPLNSKTDRYDISQVTDDPNEVKDTISKPNSEVYVGTKVVAATVLNYDGKADHAEYRTLQNLKTIKNHINKNDLLLIYVYASPCPARCTNIKNEDNNILKLLQDYKNYKVVFVFSKVFKPRDSIIPTKELQDALRNLGGTIGLDRIFRCDEVNGRMKCVNCSDKKNVAGWCYDDNQTPG